MTAGVVVVDPEPVVTRLKCAMSAGSFHGYTFTIVFVIIATKPAWAEERVSKLPVNSREFP